MDTILLGGIICFIFGLLVFSWYFFNYDQIEEEHRKNDYKS